MKKLLLLLALWCVPAYAQLPTQKDSTGSITASGSTCATTNACINIHLANNASTVAATLSGTFSATLTYETSGNNGVTWTTLDTQTAPGTVTYAIAGLTDMRVRASAFTSGTVGVFINSSTAAVSSLGSVTLTGTPSVGWVPTATSATTATWQASSGGGGGLSGMTAGQIPVAATATTVTSSIATTGSGNIVRATSPALVTPTGIVKGDVGLGNVVNLDTSNATNITTGTLPAAQLPNPSASTLGGIQSKAATTSNWINTISTSGVPGVSQPATTDLSDIATFNLSTSGSLASSKAGALSASAVSITGAPIATGGTGTTTFPLVYINSGAAPTTWSTAGTALGINAPSGFSGKLIDVRVNGGATIFNVANNGVVTTSGNITGGGDVNIASGNAFYWSSRSVMTSSADGLLKLSNQAQTGLLTRLTFGPETNLFPAFCNSAAIIKVCLGDGTSGGSMQANTYLTTTNCTSSAAPAVCAAASAGSVVVAAAGTTVTVNTTAVTANSQILLTEDSSLGTKLSVTCNTTAATALTVTTRTAGTSFVITTNAPTTNPRCISYMIVN